MSTNLLSRFLPPTPGSPSVYETIREHEEAHAEADGATEGADAVDTGNFREKFRDEDIEHLLADAAESQVTTESTAFLTKGHQDTETHGRKGKQPRWMRDEQRIGRGLDEEDDVPESLLLDGPRLDHISPVRRERHTSGHDRLPDPVPGPSTRRARVQWNTTRAQQQLYNEPERRTGRDVPASMTASEYHLSTAEEKASSRWTHLENLDNFLADVYHYYVQKGIWSITLARALRLAQLAFVVGIGIFLNYCVDYSSVPSSKALPEVVVPRCTKRMSFFASFVLWLFIGWWFLMLADMILDLRRLRQLHDFFVYMLRISDEEIQTISWQEIVGRLMGLRDANPRTSSKVSPKTRRYLGGEHSKDRMDAHDIANRIMRKENYMIALFNKDILDMSLPVPFLRNRQLYSRNLEWNINQAILGFFFNDQGQVFQYFLKDTDRKRLIEALRKRFIFYGFMNLIQAPFLITYSLTTYFLRYFKEFQSNPSQLSSRAYTPMAEWKFREFNELYHFFRRRADMSVPFASRYLDQFPKDKTIQGASFVAFVSGALLAVLAVASLLDPGNFLNFELSSGRTVLFYSGILFIVWTVSRGIVPEENQVFDPEYAVQEVINYTHYCPASWKGRLHSDDVRKDFSSLYQMRILIFIEELMSIMFTPLVLWFSLPNRSDRIVDFFREFTVHVDGLGYVCSFALFEFKKGESANVGDDMPVPTTAERGLREDYYASKDNKMLASYFSFIDSYGANPGKKPYRPTRHRFQPPPAFPGLSSSAAGPTPAQSRSPKVARASSRSMHRSQMDPSQSLLLDPHHQPPPSLSRRLYHSRHLQRDDDVLEEEQEDVTRDRDASPREPLTSTTMLEEDSKLGDSWKTTRAAATDDDDEDDGRGAGAGVLGLLYQFQQAQADGKGTSMGI